MPLGLRWCGAGDKAEACTQQKSREGMPKCSFQSQRSWLESKPHSKGLFSKRVGGEGGCRDSSTRVTVATIIKQLRLSAGHNKEAENFLWLMQTNLPYSECSAYAKVFSCIFHVVA